MAKRWTLYLGRVRGERAASIACHLLGGFFDPPAKAFRLAVAHDDTTATYLLSVDRSRRFTAKEILRGRAFASGVYETLHSLDFSPLIPVADHEWGRQVSMQEWAK